MNDTFVSSAKYIFKKKKFIFKSWYSRKDLPVRVNKNIFPYDPSVFVTLEHKSMSLSLATYIFFEIVSSPSCYSEIGYRDCQEREPGVSTVCA